MKCTKCGHESDKESKKEDKAEGGKEELGESRRGVIASLMTAPAVAVARSVAAKKK